MVEPGSHPHPFDLAVSGAAVPGGRVLTVTVRKEFELSNLNQGWAAAIIAQAPNQVDQVVIDMAAIGLVSSTFFAGLLHLHEHYTTRGAATLVLRKPDRRIERNLRVMRLDQLFAIESR
jgi:anti-anti-sigma regulatory factor